MVQNMGLQERHGWMEGWRDGQGTRKEWKGKQQRWSERGRDRAAQNMRLKSNVLERGRERESRACHAFRGNCTLAEC